MFLISLSYFFLSSSPRFSLFYFFFDDVTSFSFFWKIHSYDKSAVFLMIVSSCTSLQYYFARKNIVLKKALCKIAHFYWKKKKKSHFFFLLSFQRWPSILMHLIYRHNVKCSLMRWKKKKLQKKEKPIMNACNKFSFIK